MLDEKYFHTIIFNGMDLRSFGLYLKKRFIYHIPKWNFNFHKIAGKSGQIVTDGNEFDNVEEIYEFWMYKKDRPTACDDYDVLKSLTDWLATQKEYSEFRDSWHKGEYSYAVCTGISDLKQLTDGFLEGKITFSRIPWWYLSSELPYYEYTLQSGHFTSALNNPTIYDSEPLIELYLEGSSAQAEILFKIWGGINTDLYEQYTINRPENSYLLTLDGETGVFKVDSTVRNDLISFDKLPKLRRTNYFSATFPDGLNVRLRVHPRWRRL